MSKPLVLIIEDEEDLAEIYSTTLDTYGFVTEVIDDGKKALERLNGPLPNLIMLDLHLPLVSGASILEYIRSSQSLSKVPVIVTTADERQAEELEGKADLVLLKPVSVGQLREFSARLAKK